MRQTSKKGIRTDFLLQLIKVFLKVSWIFQKSVLTTQISKHTWDTYNTSKVIMKGSRLLLEFMALLCQPHLQNKAASDAIILAEAIVKNVSGISKVQWTWEQMRYCVLLTQHLWFCLQTHQAWKLFLDPYSPESI